ncbi:MAG: FecR domain-containing protein [Brucellaceae bacterium]|jgi:transmembrane sensor|nr:FecR domain-containing protein [Brucellaceae bacterium]
MSHNHLPSEEQREAAALWFAKRTGSALSPVEELEFETWLNENRLNRLAWDEMRVLWAHLEQPAERIAQATPPRSGLTQYFSRWHSWLKLTGGLVATTLIVLIINPHFINDIQADIVSGREIVTPVILPDGSRVQLAANTAITFEFDQRQRHVRLLRGEAYFEVTPGSAPDFSIDIDGDTVRVIGTHFNVDRIADKTTVLVSEGIVSVQGAQDTAPEKITQGQEITVASGTAGAIRSGNIDSSMAWMSGRLVVDRTPVDDVVATLARHTPAKLYVRGKLKEQMISGTFSLEDIDGSLETIAAALNAKINRNIPFLTILY